MAVSEFLRGAGGAHGDGQLDEVGLEVPLPPVRVAKNGVGVVGHHGKRPVRGVVAEAGELLDDHLVEVAIIGEAVLDEDVFEAGEVDDFAGFDGGATSEAERGQ